MNISIKLFNHNNVVMSGMFDRSYSIGDREAHEAIYRAIEEYKDTNNFIDDFMESDLNDLEVLQKGSYTLDCGDYSYHIIITDEKGI